MGFMARSNAEGTRLGNTFLVIIAITTAARMERIKAIA